MKPTLKNSLAVLDNLFEGKPLPEKLAVRKKDADEAIARLERARLDASIKDNLTRAPLIAVCFNVSCKRCGAKWDAFGHYARKVKQPVMGFGTAEITRRVDYVPFGEKPVETTWLPTEEEVCLSCYGGPKTPLGH